MRGMDVRVRLIASIALLARVFLAVGAVTGITAVVLLAASEAQAACAPAASSGLVPPAGTVVTCTGTTINQNSPNGYGTGSQNGLTVNVQAAALVQGAPGLNLSSNNTIINFGTIKSLTGAPALFLSLNNTINNFGTISAASGEGIRTGAGATITNSGVISASIGIDTGAGSTITNSGAISATSIGIQSLAGSTVTNTGTIAAGNNVFAAVLLFNGGNTIINSGTITGRGTAGAIFFNLGTNALNNYGTITTVAGISGLAIQGNTGNEAITNFGTITGTVDLGTGGGSFDNRAGATFNAGPTVNLVAGTLTNSGTISPGGLGTVLTTTLTGDLVQTSTGTYATDVDLVGGNADQINVSGTASLAGTVVAKVDTLKSGPQTFTILTAGGGVTNSGLGLVASPALNAALSFVGKQC